MEIIEYVAVADRGRALDVLRERRTLLAPLGRNSEYVLLRRAGSSFPAEISSSVILRADGEPSAITLVIRDISERKLFQTRLQHQVFHDALTDPPNRRMFQERLEELIDVACREGSSCALLLLDLDGFKDLNDTFGHDLGDRLLQRLAQRLRETCRDSDMVARLGGDEFALVLPRTHCEDALLTATRVSAVVRSPVTLDGHTLVIDGSIGIAVYPEDGTDAVTLLRRSDVAMYAAKRDHTPYIRYHQELDHQGERRLALSQTLRQALQSSQFLLQYQPKLDLRTGTISGVEALIRWLHPTLGMVPPGEFIPLAEGSGLITSITRWVLDEALSQARRWHDAGLDVQVAVNLSARSLHDHKIVDVIHDSLTRAGAVPAWLAIEITESHIMTDPGRALRTLERLRATGVAISIDDFGTGFSSLAYLATLPADELKIDRAFVRELETNYSHRRIVQATINLAHELRLEAVAEGVETQQAVDILRGLGCDTVQGYFISRPLQKDDVEPSWARANIALAAARGAAS